MTLTIDIPPELEDRLQEEAGRRGVAAEELARTFLEERLLFPAGDPLWERLADWEQAFDEFIASQDPHRPPLPDEALSRESFYGERG
jgi:tetrahydromethanopterin S-methyltransferase subunit B